MIGAVQIIDKAFGAGTSVSTSPSVGSASSWTLYSDARKLSLPAKAEVSLLPSASTVGVVAATAIGKGSSTVELSGGSDGEVVGPHPSAGSVLAAFDAAQVTFFVSASPVVKSCLPDGGAVP